MTATAAHHTFSIRQPPCPPFIHFDPSQLVKKRSPDHYRNPRPKFKQSAQNPWSNIDSEEVVISTMLEQGPHSPNHGLLPITPQFIDQFQSDARGRNDSIQHDGDNNISTSSIHSDMRDDNGKGSTALNGRNLGTCFLLCN
jgi:hypothetical protein